MIKYFLLFTLTTSFIYADPGILIEIDFILEEIFPEILQINEDGGTVAKYASIFYSPSLAYKLD